MARAAVSKTAGREFEPHLSCHFCETVENQVGTEMENGKKRTGAVAGFDSITGKIRRFISDTMAELGRCTWPTRQQLFESTILVVVNIAILALFVAGVDWIAAWVIRLITVGKF